MAKRWADETPNIKALPEKVTKSKTAMNTLSFHAFFDELEKIANVAGDLTKTFVRAGSGVHPHIPSPTIARPKIRAHVNPATIVGGAESLKNAPRAQTAVTRPRGGSAKPAAPVAEGTRAGVVPQSVPAPSAPPVGGGSSLRRQLAFGGAAAGAGMLLHKAISPSHQQNGTA